MVGAILMILVLVVVLPVLILMSMAGLMAVLGSSIRHSVAKKYANSELLVLAQSENIPPAKSRANPELT